MRMIILLAVVLVFCGWSHIDWRDDDERGFTDRQRTQLRQDIDQALWEDRTRNSDSIVDRAVWKAYSDSTGS